MYQHKEYNNSPIFTLCEQSRRRENINKQRQQQQQHLGHLLCNGILVAVIKDEATCTLVLHTVTVHALQSELASKVCGMPQWPADALVPALAFKVPVKAGSGDRMNGYKVEALNARAAHLVLIWYPGRIEIVENRSRQRRFLRRVQRKRHGQPRSQTKEMNGRAG